MLDKAEGINHAVLYKTLVLITPAQELDRAGEELDIAKVCRPGGGGAGDDTLTEPGSQSGKGLRKPEAVWAVVFWVPETTGSQNSGGEMGLGHRKRAVSRGGTVMGDDELEEFSAWTIQHGSEGRGGPLLDADFV